MAQVDPLGQDPKQKTTTILVVDDDAGIGEFLVLAFQMELNAQVLLANDAVRALEITETIIPDLFIIDYQLPGINGLELAERFSLLPTCASIPVLLMSANIPKHSLKSLNMAIIEKPFELDDILQVVNQLIEPRDSTKGQE